MTKMPEPCRAYEPLMTDALFDALSPADRERLEAHLCECAACAAVYGGLQATLAATAAPEREDPGPAFWDGYYDRLVERMEPAPASGRRRSVPMWPDPAAWLVRLRALVAPVPRGALRLAVAVVLVAAGVVVGRSWPEEQAALPLAEGPAVSPEVVQPVALEARAQHYLSRSRVLLIGLVNMDAGGSDGVAPDLRGKQRVARTLVDEAAGLRSELAAADQQRLEQLVGDLEMILLQIANLEARADVPAIEMVQAGVDRKGLLLKIDVEELRLAAPPADGRPIL